MGGIIPRNEINCILTEETQNSQIMEDKIKKALAEYGLPADTVDLLTKEELEQLKEEIKAKENGALFLDGVLCNPELLYSRRFKKEQEKADKKK